MSVHAPTKIYAKDKKAFERLRAMPFNQLLGEPVLVLPLSVRAQRYCMNNNIETIGQLAKAKKKDMLKAKNMGERTIRHIDAYLHEIGLGLDGRVAATMPPAAPVGWLQGARAMRFAIMAELSMRDIPYEIVSYIGRMPVPNPTEDL